MLQADDEETHVLEHLGEYKNEEEHVVMQKNSQISSLRARND